MLINNYFVSFTITINLLTILCYIIISHLIYLKWTHYIEPHSCNKWIGKSHLGLDTIFCADTF